MQMLLNIIKDFSTIKRKEEKKVSQMHSSLGGKRKVGERVSTLFTDNKEQSVSEERL